MFGINGMEQNDTGALTPEQQQKLNEFKVRKCVSKETRWTRFNNLVSLHVV